MRRVKKPAELIARLPSLSHVQCFQGVMSGSPYLAGTSEHFTACHDTSKNIRNLSVFHRFLEP